MDSKKNPISLLQEYAMQTSIALPTYNTLQEGLNFKCTVIIGNIIKTAIAANKKKAKQNAAEKALSILYPYNNNYKMSITQDSNVNSVGQLNEFCSKNGKDYPTYETDDNGQSEFIVKCKLFEYISEGRGKNKKEAKQNAAHNMLQRVQSFVSEIPNSNKSDNSEVDSKTIELYKKLSIQKKKGLAEVGKLNNNTYKFYNFNNLDMNQAHTENYLEIVLNNLGLKYKIYKLQTNPLILCLKMNNDPPYTILHCGTNFSETRLTLLQKTCDVVSILFNEI